MSVLNITYYDSDNENDEFGGGEDENFDDKKEKSPDQLTEELCDVLENKLSEVASVNVVGFKSFRLNFYESKIKFEDKDCNCDFDLDIDKIPIMPNCGQEFIIPYLYELKEFYPDLAKCKFQTNSNTIFNID